MNEGGMETFVRGRSLDCERGPCEEFSFMGVSRRPKRRRVKYYMSGREEEEERNDILCSSRSNPERVGETEFRSNGSVCSVSGKDKNSEQDSLRLRLRCSKSSSGNEKGQSPARLRFVFPKRSADHFVNNSNVTPLSSINSPCSERCDGNGKRAILVTVRVRPPAESQVRTCINSSTERGKRLESKTWQHQEHGKEASTSELSQQESGREGRRLESGTGNRAGGRYQLRPRSGRIATRTKRGNAKKGIDSARLKERRTCARTEYLYERGTRLDARAAGGNTFARGGTAGLVIGFDSRVERKPPGESGETRDSGAELYVTKSVIHGLGVFAGKRIGKGGTIAEFVGERIRETVSDARERRGARDGCFYVFGLAERGGSGVRDGYCLDGTRRGGVARFINHSCAPNAQAVVSEGRVFVKAVREVHVGEEVTLDYGSGGGLVRCYCGECRAGGS